MKHILVTNDDGIYGPGLEPLVRELGKTAKVTAVVPDQERSGTSHSITLHKPLRVQKLNARTYIVNGTPADCVRFGALSLMRRQVDLVVSGINAGPNMGHDVIYSGTVAGAREGVLLKIPSFAVSIVDLLHPDFAAAARVAAKLAAAIFKSSLPPNIYLNVNVPNRARGYAVTSLGQRIYDEEIECRTDPRGMKYYWLAGKFVSGVQQPGTDITAVARSLVSLTPLQLDPTATQLFGVFDTWKKSLH
jgi:5'-nucleotidase